MLAAALHDWWTEFGEIISVTDCPVAAVRTLADHVVNGGSPAATLVEARLAPDGQQAALLLEIEVERPQVLEAPIRGVEPVAVVFGSEPGQPAVLALRPDFPETMHQNWMPEGYPRALCIDDRPWQEAELTYTHAEFLKRIQLWLAKAASGELHDSAQPLEPLFFHNPLTLVIPKAVLNAEDQPAELVGFGRGDNPSIILTRLADPRGDKAPPFVVIPVLAPPRGMNRIAFAPQSLAALGVQLSAHGFDLGDLLRERILAWSGLGDDAVRRLNARIALIVAFPVQGPSGRTAHDLRTFITHQTAGEVGVAMGMLSINDSDVGTSKGYLRVFGAGPQSDLPDLRIDPADTHVAFDRETGAEVSGQAGVDRRNAVIVGAGSLGSHLAVNLAREGRFSWTIVDGDILLPHNFARHALFPFVTGAPKSPALAHHLDSLLGEPAVDINANLLTCEGEERTRLDEALSAADLILDASASVAVSRHLADRTASARRICVFFNPEGSAVVLLAEGADRAVTLRDLEAQYHRMIQTRPALDGHLRLSSPGIRYSGSCRAVTNRISASSAALMGAIASQAVADASDAPAARISVWTVNGDLSVSCIQEEGETVERKSLGAWTITYAASVAKEIEVLRQQRLPHETGGILLGIVDTSAQIIQIVQALAAPVDSTGSVCGFERGVVGLAENVRQAAERSLHQLRYIGEWHSHPAGSSTMPSVTDIRQMCWLTEELQNEGLPAVMGIAGDNGALTLMLMDSPAESERAVAS